MANPLDFSIVANNDEAVIVTVNRKDGSLISLTGFTILWGLFLNGIEIISKTSADITQIAIPDQNVPANVGKFTMYINAAETLNLETETLYVHEFNFIDPFAKSANPTKLDKELTAGEVYLRRQYKKQP